ncbi:PucR family transcriptional regulator [Tissierella creatinophila]|uniref:Purine catabolism regulatory protein n=1 Tax=Tissierella creatinophila DSM 6911 TaxID=1123403 RepID=A0A1U7M3J5_TISCR|nr:PucR family transcriptional regulator [Tissierella creatinophila]OLS01789.1 purine catabolism regulatory protein [Tissierella creatinophila DSM 6911]
MYIKVKDVLEIDEFKGSHLISGKEGIYNIVTNAMLMEVPDIFPYVESNSLLITTLYPIFSDEEAIKSLIPKLVERKVSGICIKPARYIKEIPLIMIEQSNKFNFPIIELPKDANLSKLVSSILELSLRNYISVLNFRNYVHERLMKLFLNGEDINALINNLSEIVDYPVLLLDNDMNITHISQDISKENVSILSTNDNKYNELIIKLQDKEYDENTYIKYSIKAGESKFGYILLLKGENENKNLIVAVEQAALLIASVFYKNYAVMEKERSFQDAFIRDILQGKIYSPIDIIKNAKNFGWDIKFPQAIMIIKILTDNYEKKKEIYEYILYSNIIEKTLEKYMSINLNKIKIVYIDDSLVIFINSIFINDIRENFIEIGKMIIKNLNTNIKMGIGISNIINNINDFPLAYSEAQQSIVAGSILNKTSFVSHYSDYEMFAIIKEVRDIDILKKYLNNKLGKIIEYDKETNMELMETLKALIEENFNIKKASEKLFIHYNTLRYRIERIKELGIEIKDGFFIGELVLAYNIYLWLNANDS